MGAAAGPVEAAVMLPQAAEAAAEGQRLRSKMSSLLSSQVKA
jgi:hypothetical protein